MFGYTIVKKIYIKRLKEELALLYDLNEKLDKETGELRLRARMADQAVDMQLGKIVHLEGLNRELTEMSRTPLPASESDHGVDWDVERNQPVWITMADQIEAHEQTIAALTGERDCLAAELAEFRGNPRDEYHTMEELYEYRMLYNALAANAMPDRAVKSWRHSDGEPCFGGGWFVVYLDLPTGQVSNHYKSCYWDLFRILDVDVAPEWDGHTPAEAADRISRAL